MKIKELEKKDKNDVIDTSIESEIDKILNYCKKPCEFIKVGDTTNITFIVDPNGILKDV